MAGRIGLIMTKKGYIKYRKEVTIVVALYRQGKHSIKRDVQVWILTPRGTIRRLLSAYMR